MMFRRYPVISQLCIFISMTCLLLVIVALIALSTLRDSMLDERKTRLVNIIEKTEAIFETYNMYYHSGVLTLEEAQSQALQRLTRLDDNYIFVFNDDYILLASLQGIDTVNSNVEFAMDSAGTLIYQTIHKAAKQLTGDGFTSYSFPLVRGGDAARKVSYSKYFPAWGWTYGSGVYIDDIDDVISQTLRSFDELVVQNMTQESPMSQLDSDISNVPLQYAF
jgi:signal transduction histidine kinase